MAEQDMSRAYKVIEDYPSSAPQNLELRKGDYITHVKPLNKEWALGRNVRTEETGFFPVSYTEYSSQSPELPRNPHRTTMILPEDQNDSDDETIDDETPNLLKQKTPMLKKGDGDINLAAEYTSSLIKAKSYHKKAEQGRYNQPGQFEMNEEALQTNTGNLIGELTQRLRSGFPINALSPKTSRIIRRIVLMVCGILLGALFCGGLFSICVYSFGYTYKVSGIITGVAFLLVLIGAVGSRFLSCCLLLVVPSLFTSQGRGLVLAAIFILLMSGPGSNIAYNTVEVSRCLACVADLIQNQLMQLAKQILQPLYRIASALKNVFQTVVDALTPVVDTINSIVSELESFLGKVEEIAGEISKVFSSCEKTMADAKSSCTNGIKQAEKDCEDAVNAAQKWLEDAAKTVVNAVKSIWGKRRRRAIGFLPLNSCGTPTSIMNSTAMRGKQTDMKERRSRSFDALTMEIEEKERLSSPAISRDQQGNYRALSTNKVTRDRRKRSVASSICGILGKVDVVCSVVDIPAYLCKAINFVSDELSSAASAALSEFNKFKKEFVFGFNASFNIDNNITSSKTASQIVTEVLADISSKVSSITTISGIISQALGVTVLLLFIKAVIYMTRYMKQDFYDNIYISPEFIEYDEKCKKSGRESVLPLKFREHSRYIITSLPFPTGQELSSAFSGLTAFFTHFGIAVIVIGFDYALYYLLVLIGNYGQVAVLSSSVSSLNITVEGSGFLANFFRDLIANLDLNVNMTVEFNITNCLPNPSRPSESNIPVFSVLYGGVLFLVFVQMYSHRIRRVITSHFYPDREQERCRLLHELIRHRRKTLFTWVRQQLHLRRHDVDNRVSIRGLLEYSSIGILCKPFLDICLPRKVTCISCEEVASGNVSFRKCKQCKSLYCKNCFEMFQNNCLLCHAKHQMKPGKK